MAPSEQRTKEIKFSNKPTFRLSSALKKEPVAINQRCPISAFHHLALIELASRFRFSEEVRSVLLRELFLVEFL